MVSDGTDCLALHKGSSFQEIMWLCGYVVSAHKYLLYLT